MIRARRVSAAVLLTFVFAAGSAFASWYDDYDAGIAACNKGQWAAAIAKMTSAINAHPKEGDHERTYGAIFYNYHPYYYRAVAYLNSGKYEQAIADFEKTSGPGEADLGSIDTLMGRAKTKLAAASAPPPEPQPPAPQPSVPQPRPVPVMPAAPSIDPAVRQQASGAIEAAKGRLAAAQQRKAGSSPQYAQATQALTNALTQNATAKSNDDLQQVIALAQSAATIADLAPAPGAPPPSPAAVAAAAPKPVAASAIVLGDSAKRVRSALESYFRGDFEEASRAFKQLTTELPRNGWIYAFLGASQYSQYAFEADLAYRDAALESFRKAKASGKFKNGLPERYFSKRIRNVFKSLS
jgi:tetratricopeptide (TPR) repeat protein